MSFCFWKSTYIHKGKKRKKKKNEKTSIIVTIVLNGFLSKNDLQISTGEDHNCEIHIYLYKHTCMYVCSCMARLLTSFCRGHNLLTRAGRVGRGTRGRSGARCTPLPQHRPVASTHLHVCRYIVVLYTTHLHGCRYIVVLSLHHTPAWMYVHCRPLHHTPACM